MEPAGELVRGPCVVPTEVIGEVTYVEGGVRLAPEVRNRRSTLPVRKNTEQFIHHVGMHRRLILHCHNWGRAVVR